MTAAVLFLIGFLLILAALIVPSAGPTAPVLPRVGQQVWPRRPFQLYGSAGRGYTLQRARGAGRFPVTRHSVSVVLGVCSERVRLRVYFDPLAGWLSPVEASLTLEEFARLYGKRRLLTLKGEFPYV